jgi:hypothetical protein
MKMMITFMHTAQNTPHATHHLCQELMGCLDIKTQHTHSVTLAHERMAD